MIYVDAREGLSGDTLVSGMLGLLEEQERKRTAARMRAAASAHGLDLVLLQIEDTHESGLGISYKELKMRMGRRAGYNECFSMLAKMEEFLGFSSPTSCGILGLIFEAEGKAHGTAPTEVHLHEIGRPQAILNIAAIGHISWRLVELGGGPFVCSAITTGKGVLKMSHGAVSVPAPAAQQLLTNMMHTPGDEQGERATPTGIAAIKTLIRYQSDEIPTTFAKRSVGFGTKRFGDRLGRTAFLWV